MEKQNDTNVCHAQVVYLYEVLHKTYSEIAEITNYAVSTIKGYVKKFADLLSWAKEIFEETIEKVRKPRASKYDSVIETNGLDITSKNGEMCYLFRFYNAEGDLLCSKVGTTTRTIRKRLIEELTGKTYKRMGATNAIVDRVWNCGDMPAEGLESLIRSEYIKKYPKSFKKNDRFINELFDLDECDKIAADYLSIA